MTPTASATPVDPLGPPAGAVEVVATLGDSVVDVRHVAPRARTSSKRPAYIVLAAGALLLALSAFAFAKGVSTAAANERALQQWTQTEGNLAYDFRPQRLGVGWDVLAFGGLGGGLAGAIFGLALLRRRELDSSYVTDEGEALVTQHGGAMIVTAADGRKMPLTAHSPVRVHRGLASYAMRWVPAPRGGLGGALSRFDGSMARFFGASAIAHMALVALLNTIPPDPSVLAGGDSSGGDVITRVETKPNEDERREIEPADAEGADGDDEAATAAALGAEGKAGEHDVDAEGKRRIARVTEEKTLSREQALRHARNTGVVGAFRGGDFFHSLASFDEISSGEFLFDEAGLLHGDEYGPGGGFGGNGNRFRGPGGGGPGLIGSDPYATISMDPDGGWKTGPPSGNLMSRDHDKNVPEPTVGDVRKTGELDRAIIRRHIRRKLPRFQHCYERTLLVDPGAEGQVVIHFFISPQGAVLQASARGMGNGALSSCVASITENIAFPASGGTTEVTYPLDFHRAGQ